MLLYVGLVFIGVVIGYFMAVQLEKYIKKDDKKE